VENLPSGAPHGYLVGIKMLLTAAQRRKAEHIYLCKKMELMKQVADSSRSRNR
jgi:hypothetical protein